ncbi:MAG: iron ABC transporter permease [Myxococcales bacterium]|nr:iron ABC transporter permease [Myxococcales bacterium]
MNVAIRFSPLRAAAVLLGLSVLALFSLALAVALGEQPISLRAALEGTSTDAAIFWSLRLPRAALAAIVGASLAASGCTLQGLMRNPLADPFVLGVSGGAALGATLALALGLGELGATASAGGGLLRLSAPSVFALAGALGATALVSVLGRSAGARSPHATLLSGVIFNAFALGAITFVKTLAEPGRMGEIFYWLAGSLGYESGWTLLSAGLFELLALSAMWLAAGRLNLLMLGDEDAASLGVPVERTRTFLLVASSLSVAVAVALAGLVGFVGLIVPHLLRMWLGPDQRLLVPASAVGGAAFLMLSDLFARLLFNVFGGEPPVGAITALLGGPFFLFLLRREERIRA